jgi:hypothetical protein
MVVITGVPREDRYGVRAGNVSESSELRNLRSANVSPDSPPASEPSEAPSPPRRIYAQIKPPTEDNPSGVIAEGTYTIRDGVV